MINEMTDDDAVEYCRQQMQEILDRAAEMYRAGKQPADFFSKEKADGRGTTGLITVLATDLREVGSFLLDFPKDFDTGLIAYARKQWVYEHISNKTVFVLSLASRTQLQRQGYATLSALKPEPKN